MPNRIIKESICVSEQIDCLSPEEEVTFYRLLVNCDDYGCFDAREKVVISRLFPLRDISTQEIRSILDRLESVGLIQLYQVDGKPYLNVCKWSEHQRVRVSVHKYPMPPQVAASCGELRRVAADGGKMRLESESQSESESESLSESFIADEDAKKIQIEQNRVLDAAEDAGFGKSNSVRAGLLKLYADYGLEKMLSGFESCVKHGVSNIAYLEAVLKGAPRKAKGAQDYEQRDYSAVQNDAMKRQAARIAARKDASNFAQRDYSDVPGQIMTGIAEELKDFQKGAG